MKILKLTFANLASLAGAYEIDFEEIEKQDGGMYVICGPTGSGKSTVLDAICLALYGETPRLKNNLGNGQEALVMSRGTSECYAIVDFSLNGKRYRSSWRQYRARGKADGKVQPEKVELAELAPESVILSSQKRNHLEQIIQLTGLDFGRFTKVILLAQGQFQNFLRADDSGRAELLEKITGTQIYSEISTKVFEITRKYKEEQDRYELLLKSKLEGVNEDQSVEELQKSQADCREKTKEASRRLIEFQALQNWHLEESDLQSRQKQLDACEIELKPAQEKLVLAQSAQEIQQKYFTTLSIYRKNEQLRDLDRQKIATDLELCKKEKTVSEGTAQVLQAGVQKAVEEKKCLYPILIRVRAMDAQIKSAKKSWEETQNQWKQKEQNKKDALVDLASMNAELKKNTDWLERSMRWQKEHAGDEALQGDFNKIELLAKQWKDQEKGKQKPKKDFNALLKRVALQKAELEKNNAKLKQLELKSVTASQTKQKLLQDNERVLNGKQPKDFRQEKDTAQQHLKLLEQWKDRRVKWEDLQKKQGIKEVENKALLQKLEKIPSQIKSLETEEQQKKQRLQHLEEILSFVHKVADVKKMREELSDDKPCPVCGSTNHPYALGNIPTLTDEAMQIAKLKKELDVLQITKSNLKSDAAMNRTRTDFQKKELAEWKEDARILQNDWIHIAAELSLSNDVLLSDIDGLLITQNQKIDRLESTIKKIELLQKNLQNAEKETAEADKAEAAERLVLEREKSAFDAAVTQKNQAEKSMLEIQKQCAESQDKCWHAIEKYFASVGDLSIEAFDDLLIKLTHRQKEWQQKEKERLDLLSRRGPLEGKIAFALKSVPKLQKEWEEQQQICLQKKQELEQFSVARCELFGERNPDVEEKECLNREEKLQNKLKNAQNRLQQLQEQWSRLDESQRQNSAALAENSKLLAAQEKEFTAALTEKGFADEANWHSYLLDSISLENLQKKCREFVEQKRLWKEKQRLHQDAFQKFLGEMQNMPKETVTLQCEQWTKAQNESQQELGRLKEVFVQIEKNKKEIDALQKKRSSSKKIYDEWEQLNFMIGSAKGDKFRRIVQGITLDYVLESANIQLANMMERYVLVRSQALNSSGQQTLELRVIDHWQNDLERDVANISGGESFVVSLALALGLSAMNRGSLKIMSLFLDEGFGTLDGKILEDTLQMLCKLNQGGRQIGLISHMEALKESIGVRLEVCPKGNTGVSTISGVGCRKIK